MPPTENDAVSKPKEFYSIEEVAELLGVNYQLIYKLVRSGQLPAARIGKVYRVTRSDLDAYIEKSKRHAGGGTCSVCGNTYHSRLSLKNACVVCGAPICIDCWSRQHIHACTSHAVSGDASSEAQPTGNN
jgi:excisionase family DNA binding protein